MKRVFIYVFIKPIILSLSQRIVDVIEQKKVEKRYRKIIKKGIFWDTEYLIESYKKSKFINHNFNWKLKLLEMIQDKTKTNE